MTPVGGYVLREHVLARELLAETCEQDASQEDDNLDVWVSDYY